MKFAKDPKVSDGQGSDKFLKLQPNESASGLFQGDPLEFYVKWENKKATVVDDSVDGAQFRFRINFLVNENGAFVPKIFEQGARVYRQLKMLNEECDLEKTVVKILRTGEGMQTNYTIIPTLKTQLSAAVLKSISQVKLNDLSPAKKSEEKNSEGSPFGDEPMPGDDDLPF